MILGSFVLLVALGLSAVAAYYSIVGLVAIFAAAALPIIIMGSILEVAKITVTVWLHQHWARCGVLMKSYLTVAVIALMFITSMGIYGFLSKAHIEQTLSVGNNAVVIEDIDRQIAVQQKIINDANIVVAQLDSAVQSLIDAQRIRGANGSIAVRESQKAEREALNQSIATANSAIAALNEQKLPLIQSQQQLEAEVGPLKYIAALIYGDTLSHDLLENAVRWVIILIVAVFDPLAIVMVLAATESFKWAREQKNATVTPASVTSSLDSARETLVEEPLGKDFEEVLYRNRWDLYETTTVVEPDPAVPTVDPEKPKPVVDHHKPSYTSNYTPVTVEFGNFDITVAAEVTAQPAVQTEEPTAKVEEPTESRSVIKEIVARQREESAAMANITADNEISNSNIQFGVKYPSNPTKGDLFLRVDFLPTRLFKFNGNRWVEVDRHGVDRYTYNEAYIEMLINKISQGEYSPDWLTAAEREMIEQFLEQDNTNKATNE